MALIRLQRGLTVLNEVRYESNDLNQRTMRSENGTQLMYGYDELLRLKSVDRTQPGAPTPVEAYTCDGRNELLSHDGFNFTYDLNGNLSSSTDGSWGYQWDLENRLERVVKNGVEAARFEYDPLGRRIAKLYPGGYARFAYDGEDTLVEQTISGIFTYIHGPRVDEPLAKESSTGVRTYYHADALGSIIKRADASGNVVGTQTYDSFGIGTGLANGYGFTGRETDVESGLGYYRARYYDPKIGRFLSNDPIRFFGGINFYAYANNSPTTLTDPYGLDAIDPSAKNKHIIETDYTQCLISTGFDYAKCDGVKQSSEDRTKQGSNDVKSLLCLAQTPTGAGLPGIGTTIKCASIEFYRKLTGQPSIYDPPLPPPTPTCPSGNCSN